jgi:formate dehydrogenase iron-sulfur subunit
MAALSVGADAVARAISEQVAARRLDVTVVRNGSRGMFWLEPLVEVETAKGRVAYGPVTAEAVPGLFEAGFLDGKTHALCLGPTEEIPYLKKQERLTFARCGIVDPLSLSDYVSRDGFKGLQPALTMTPEALVEEVMNSGLRERGGAVFPQASSGRRF